MKGVGVRDDDEKRLLADVHLDGTPVDEARAPGDEAFLPRAIAPPQELEVQPPQPAPYRERPLPPPPPPPREESAPPVESHFSVLGNAVAFLVALPLSFLPARWRRGAAAQLPLASATTASGVLEASGALMIGGWLFERYRHAMADRALEVIGRAAAEGRWQAGHEGHIIGAMPTMGATLLIAFMLSPAGLASMWFFAEGLLRLGAGLAGEAVGTAPLAIVAFVIDRLRRRSPGAFEAYDAHHRFEEDHRLAAMRERLRLWWRGAEPAPPPDEVRKNDTTGEVRIYTARELGWRCRTTVEIDGELYEVVTDGPAPPPHRREYALRPVPAGTALRNIVVYR